MAVWGRRAAFYTALLLIWYALNRAGVWPEYVFPSPLEVGRALAEGIASGEYLQAVAASLRRIGLGFALSVAGGVALGVLSSRFAWVGDTLGSLTVGFQALPSICWFPLAILWLGLNEKAILFVTVAGALFAIATGVESGMRNIPPLYLRAAENMGARGLRLYLQVMLPGAMPSVLAGLRQGWSFAWRSLMAGELLSVNAGLGHLLTTGRELNDVARVVAAVVLILSIGLIVDGLVFTRIEDRVRRRWGLVRNA